ncbi:hypothetical protein OOZ51_09415, partial [Arthrobacter sp. MI7-26]|uniref:hypothetical protein n=1 Tax=Arthrobacter sp. MI7-26 TaxID=2993653 RepID=UPI002248FC46
MLGNPFGICAFKGLDLVLGDPVELLARNVVVDLGGTLAVRAVGAAQIRRVRNPCGTLFPGSAAEATSLGTRAIELAGTALRAIAEAAALSVAFTARAIAERLAVTVAKARTRVAFTTRTITIRLAIAVTKAAALTVAGWLTIAERLAIAIAKARAGIALTARTVTIRLAIAVTKARTRIAFTTRTVTIRLAIAVTKAAALTVAGWLTIAER